MFDQFSAFHFLRSQWLWLALCAPVLYLIVRRHEDVIKRWKNIIAPDLLRQLLVGRRSPWRFQPLHATCLIILLGAVAIAGPTWSREQPPFTEDKAPLVIALDLSRGMDAIDVQPTRLERAKLKIKDLLKRRQGSRTALFVYGYSAHMVLPLTTDSDLLDLYLDSLATDLLDSRPKDTAAALRAVDRFNEAEPVPGTILFVTSGVERSAFPAFLQHNEGRSPNQLLVLGVGTAAGGPLRTASGRFATDNGSRVFSKLDVDGLKRLRSEAGVPVSTLTLDNSDIDWVQRHALTHLRNVQENDAKLKWVDQGYWLILPITLLSALSFRKGWTIRWVISLFVAAIVTPHGASAQTFHFMDFWLTPDQQGRYYFERGEYAKAAERFKDPMWKGIALARLGKYDEAVNAFAILDTPESWFDQGNALAKQKKYPDAVKAYAQALRLRPHWGDAEDNLKLVRSLIPPPPKPEDEDQTGPNLKPDQIRFDEKGKKGKETRLAMGKEQMADVWMRNIQVSPADFLRRKFAIESNSERKQQ